MPDALTQGMIEQGFAHISTVEITNNDCEFHVRVTQASATRHVYHLKGKALVVQFYHSKHDYWAGEVTGPYDLTDTWEIGFCYDLLPTRELYRLAFNPEKDSASWGEDSYDPLPGFNAPLPIPDGFYQAGYLGNFTICQRDFHNPASPERLCAVVKEILTLLLPILARDFDEPIPVERFMPLYVFKDCRDIFLERFDTNYFRKIMPRPKSRFRRYD